jgi:hypothetical protein
MRRALVAEHDATLAIAGALGLAAGETGHLRAQPRDLAVLPRDHIGEVIDGADEMGQSFLDRGQGAGIRAGGLPVNLAPACPLG